jgi:hypothetical protein
MLSKDTVEQMTEGQKEIYLTGVQDGKNITKHLLEIIVKSRNKDGSRRVYTDEEVIQIIRRVK